MQPVHGECECMIMYLGEGVSYSLHMQVYAAWETDVVIGRELWRNLTLAGTAVFFVTLFFLGNLKVKKSLLFQRFNFDQLADLPVLFPLRCHDPGRCGGLPSLLGRHGN